MFILHILYYSFCTFWTPDVHSCRNMVLRTTLYFYRFHNHTKFLTGFWYSNLFQGLFDTLKLNILFLVSVKEVIQQHNTTNWHLVSRSANIRYCMICGWISFCTKGFCEFFSFKICCQFCIMNWNIYVKLLKCVETFWTPC